MKAYDRIEVLLSGVRAIEERIAFVKAGKANDWECPFCQDTAWYLAVECEDGNEVIEFDEESDLMNFMIDIQDHVYGMAIAYEEL